MRHPRLDRDGGRGVDGLVDGHVRLFPFFLSDAVPIRTVTLMTRGPEEM
jgi:hypothetical protein